MLKPAQVLSSQRRLSSHQPFLLISFCFLSFHPLVSSIGFGRSTPSFKKKIFEKKKKKMRPSPDTKYVLLHCLCSVNTECNPRAVWLKGFDSRKRISPLYVSFFVVLFREDSRKIYLDSSFLENACTVYWFGFNQTCRNAPCCVNVSRRIQEKLKVHLQRLV